MIYMHSSTENNNAFAAAHTIESSLNYQSTQRRRIAFFAAKETAACRYSICVSTPIGMQRAQKNKRTPRSAQLYADFKRYFAQKLSLAIGKNYDINTPDLVLCA